MPIPDVPWGGRDTSALAHELIHRWVHEGADPAAIDAARARHAARGEDLRVAARALERAQSDLGGAWQGRNAEAAGAHLRSLVARMSGLSDAVSGQASSLGAIRDALTRVQAAVRSPRPPVFGPLRAPPAAAGLGEAVLSGPRDGFGLFQAAQAEERAAQAAYQAYLRETSVAARATPPAMEVALARVPVPGPSASPGAPETAAPARGAAARAPGSGALARAAAAEPAVPGAPGPAAAPGGAPGTSPGAPGTPGAPGDPAAPGAARVPPGAAPTRGAAAVGGASPSGAAARPGTGGPPEVPGRAASPPGVPAPAAGGTGGTLGRAWQRILGPELGTARAAPGAPPRPGPPAGPPPGTAAGGDVGLPAGGVPGAGVPAPRRRETDPRARPGPSGTTPATAADRLAGGDGGPEQDGDPGRADRAAHGGPESAPASWSNPTAPPAPTAPGAHTGMSPAHGIDPPGGAPAGSAPPPPSTGTGMGPLPGAGLAGAGGAAGGAGDDDRPVARRHPEYLVEADPWGEGDDARLVTPPVLGAEDDR